MIRKIVVKPNSNENAVLEDTEDHIKVSVKAPPDKGKANTELVKYLSKLWKKKVEIVSGFNSRTKLVKIV